MSCISSEKNKGTFRGSQASRVTYTIRFYDSCMCQILYSRLFVKQRNEGGDRGDSEERMTVSSEPTHQSQKWNDEAVWGQYWPCTQPPTAPEVPSYSWSWPLTCLSIVDEQKANAPAQINNVSHYCCHYYIKDLAWPCTLWLKPYFALAVLQWGLIETVAM